LLLASVLLFFDVEESKGETSKHLVIMGGSEDNNDTNDTAGHGQNGGSGGGGHNP
jgi:hypothetical protein